MNNIIIYKSSVIELKELKIKISKEMIQYIECFFKLQKDEFIYGISR